MTVEPVSLYVEHVRSFAQGQTVPIRPLTLLVGENSSGKSTLLAVAAHVFDPTSSLSRPDLNRPPFNLGTFETVATFKGGKYGRDDTFTIGFSAGKEGSRHFRELKATYHRDQGGTGLLRLEVRSGAARISLQAANERLSGEIILPGEENHPEQTLLLHDSAPAYERFQQSWPLTALFPVLLSALGPTEWRRQSRLLERLFALEQLLQPPFRSVVPLAPIRTKPRRTYDELSEDYSPEGDHVPRVLARLLSEEPTGTARQLQEALRRFGAESGLFKDVGVKKLGKGPESPFQVQVGVGGPRFNLVDVGYGVSQALPLIVQSALRRDNSLLLLQQPEAHLHPRAQAALGTFFAEVVALGRDTLLVETHSDFLIDRVRHEVARGTLTPEQVQILFLDRPRLETTIYPVELDRCGNVSGAPEHYREFFLEEQFRLLKQAGG